MVSEARVIMDVHSLNLHYTKDCYENIEPKQHDLNHAGVSTLHV